jgi:hypothetical protein
MAVHRVPGIRDLDVRVQSESVTKDELKQVVIHIDNTEGPEHVEITAFSKRISEKIRIKTSKGDCLVPRIRFIHAMDALVRKEMAKKNFDQM